MYKYIQINPTGNEGLYGLLFEIDASYIHDTCAARNVSLITVEVNWLASWGENEKKNYVINTKPSPEKQLYVALNDALSHPVTNDDELLWLHNSTTNKFEVYLKYKTNFVEGEVIVGASSFTNILVNPCPCFNKQTFDFPTHQAVIYRRTQAFRGDLSGYASSIYDLNLDVGIYFLNNDIEDSVSPYGLLQVMGDYNNTRLFITNVGDIFITVYDYGAEKFHEWKQISYLKQSSQTVSDIRSSVNIETVSIEKRNDIVSLDISFTLSEHTNAWETLFTLPFAPLASVYVSSAGGSFTPGNFMIRSDDGAVMATGDGIEAGGYTLHVMYIAK